MKTKVEKKMFNVNFFNTELMTTKFKCSKIYTAILLHHQLNINTLAEFLRISTKRHHK